MWIIVVGRNWVRRFWVLRLHVRCFPHWHVWIVVVRWDGIDRLWILRLNLWRFPHWHMRIIWGRRIRIYWLRNQYVILRFGIFPYRHMRVHILRWMVLTSVMINCHGSWRIWPWSRIRTWGSCVVDE